MCVAEVGLAVAIVRQSPWAAKASNSLLPFELAYWTGFALPFGSVFGLGRILLLRPHPTSVDAGAKGTLGASAGRAAGREAIGRLPNEARFGSRRDVLR